MMGSDEILSTIDGDDAIPSDLELRFWDVSSVVFATFEPLSVNDFVLRENTPTQKVYDLSERTALFGEQVILLAKKVPFSPVNNRTIDQFVGAGTSVGANYCEASDYISPKDFRHRISSCRKEASETRFWLRMLATAEPSLKDEARVLWREATELNLIFGAIWRKGKIETRNSKYEI